MNGDLMERALMLPLIPSVSAQSSFNDIAPSRRRTAANSITSEITSVHSGLAGSSFHVLANWDKFSAKLLKKILAHIDDRKDFTSLEIAFRGMDMPPHYRGVAAWRIAQLSSPAVDAVAGFENLPVEIVENILSYMTDRRDLVFLAKAFSTDAGLQYCRAETAWRFAQCNQDWPRPWFDAIDRADLESVQFHVDNKKFIGLDINMRNGENRTALQLATHAGHEKIVELLLRDEAIDLQCSDKKNNAVLLLAIRFNHENICEQLFRHQEKNFNVTDNQKRTALQWAARLDKVHRVRMLLDFPTIDVNAGDRLHRTALHYAAHFGRLKLVRILLEHVDVDRNAQDIFGETPLIKAADKGYTEIVAALLGYADTDRNRQNRHGNTALLLSTFHHHDDVVKVLAEDKEVDVNLQNQPGYTALICAVGRGNKRIVEMLLAHEKTDLSITTKLGETALLYAKRKRNHQLAELLQKAGMSAQ